MEQQIADLEEDIARLQFKLQEQDRKIISLESKLGDAQGDITNLRYTVERLDSQINVLYNSPRL